MAELTPREWAMIWRMVLAYTNSGNVMPGAMDAAEKFSAFVEAHADGSLCTSVYAEMSDFEIAHHDLAK